MTPFSINGKVVYISDITKLAEMDDDEWDEEYRDLVAADIGEEIDNPFSSQPSSDDEQTSYPDPGDLDEVKEFIRKKMS